MFLPRFRTVCAASGRGLSSSTTSKVRQFKVVLDGQTLYIEKPLAEALGWNPATGADGVSLRLSGWDPKFFAITPTGTDFGTCFILDTCRTWADALGGRPFGQSDGGEQQKSS